MMYYFVRENICVVDKGKDNKYIINDRGFQRETRL